MAFSSLACANAYGPHTGLSSMVLQRKCSQGCTGHMIISSISCSIVNLLRALFKLAAYAKSDIPE